MPKCCRTVAVWLTVLLPVAARAQVRYDVPAGRVEVLGLKRWTLRMLQDSIRKYVPGTELHDGACMAVLRDKLHFTDAYVSRAQGFTQSAPDFTFYSIRLVEPRRFAPSPFDARDRNAFTSLRPEYANVILPITDSTGGVHSARLQFWLNFRGDSARRLAQTLVREEDRGDGKRLYDFLDVHSAEADRRAALHILETDGFWVNRMIATAVLQSFGDSATTWIAVAKALRDPHEHVRTTAAVVLEALSEREVDWSPAVADLRLLLGGANISAIDETIRALARTKVQPSLAPRLLRGNATWVLSLLSSEAPVRSSDAAHSLLVQLNRGVDLGRNPRVWSRWAASL